MNLEGILQNECKCGECNISTYPGRIYYSHEWSCKQKAWVKLSYDEQEKRFIREIEKIKK
jgi:ribosomal protein S8